MFLVGIPSMIVVIVLVQVDMAEVIDLSSDVQEGDGM